MRESQTASSVLMVRPAAFAGNPATAASNSFQQLGKPEHPGEVHRAAVGEFASLATVLADAGVKVVECQDSPEPHKPDALFPNNWVSFHADGTVVLYPLLAPNRRAERRADVLATLVDRYGFQIRRVVDLSGYEGQGRYLEGTGSLVLDRTNRIAYACLSPRTDPGLLKEFATRLEYEPIAFRATDAAGVPVYHTNVVCCVGERFAALGTAAIDPADRPRVLRKLEVTGHEILDLSLRQVSHFAGNMLELAGAEPLLVLSSAAQSALLPPQLEVLERLGLKRVAVPLPTIERLGGGSARCMIAEIHLPERVVGVANSVAVSLD